MVDSVPRGSLAQELRSARLATGRSLRAVAGEAEISAAYLQKLESATVESPSPHVLKRLAQVLSVPYRKLMILAGYELPASRGDARGLLDRKLAAASLTHAEERAVAAFVDHLLGQRP